MTQQRRAKTWVSGPPSGSPGAQVLQQMYDAGKTLKQIASELGVTATTVHRWFKKEGIVARSKSEIAKAQGFGGVHSEEHREALRRNAEIARSHVTEESRRKQSASRMGIVPSNKGVPMSEEQRQKLIELRADPEYRRQMSERFMGEKSPNWKGGQKPELARRLDRAEWRRTRLVVYERDKWICQDCGERCLNTRDSKKNPRRKIQCHHIISRRRGGSDELENLITLCMSCHHKRERKETQLKE